LFLASAVHQLGAHPAEAGPENLQCRSVFIQFHQKGQTIEKILLKKPYLRYLSTRKSLVIKEDFHSIFRKAGVFQQNRFYGLTPMLNVKTSISGMLTPISRMPLFHGLPGSSRSGRDPGEHHGREPNPSAKKVEQ